MGTVPLALAETMLPDAADLPDPVSTAAHLSYMPLEAASRVCAATAEERCRASMVLGGVGDAMGYKKGDWEFCASTSKILQDLNALTNGRGVLALSCTGWMVSDDTVEHLATAEGLVMAFAGEPKKFTLDSVMRIIARETKKTSNDFTARAPGKTEQRGIKLIDADGANWRAKPFDSGALGCGAAMRSPCIGLLFREPEQLPTLVAVAIETCRLTKTHPLGYLGGVCAATFTAFAMQGRPIVTWGPRFIEDVMPVVKAYVLGEGQRHRRENEQAFSEGIFESKLQWYFTQRGLDGNAESLQFPPNYGSMERDSFYCECAKLPGTNPSGKNPGSKGYDSVLIAYDALLWVETQLGPECSPAARWAELCHRAVLHRGDNDSTGSIAAAWFGALHGFEGVPLCHYEGVEYRGRCDAAGRSLQKAFGKAVSHHSRLLAGGD